MEKYNFGFVVLHYMALQMTTDCVNNLLIAFGDNSIHIVIVDNCSPNESGKELKRKFEGNEKVLVILNSSNEGFAKGNNIGYSYLKDNYNCDFIVVMNNDVLINDNLFLDKIKDIYLQTNFSVLGPDIYAPNSPRKHQNPFFLHGIEKEKLIKQLNQMKYNYDHFQSWYKKTLLKNAIKSVNFLSIIYRFIKYTILHKEIIDYKKEYVNPVLHGACYIFSRSFIENRDYAFFPGTFLYCEENILHFQCIQKQLKMIYSPEIHVTHLEDVSTSMVLKQNFDKEKYKMEKMIESLEIFISLMEADND